jgi:hypothetical protein
VWKRVAKLHAGETLGQLTLASLYDIKSNRFVGIDRYRSGLSLKSDLLKRIVSKWRFYLPRHGQSVWSVPAS